MKKTFTSLALSAGIFFSTMPSAQASVVAFLGQPATAVAAGLVYLTGGVVISSHHGVQTGAEGWGGRILRNMSTPVAIIGLVILDGDQAGEMSFTKVPLTSSSHQRFSKDEINTYNRELSQLNAIQQTLTREVANNPRTDINARWAQLATKLSPATLEIAAFNCEQL